MPARTETTTSESVTPATAARRRRRIRTPAPAFLAPFFVLFLLFTIAPIVYAVGLSFFSDKFSGTGFGGATREFVGVDNYARALTSPDFLLAFVHVALYCLVYIPVMITIALAIALLLDSAVARARSFFRVSFYLPNIVPGLIAAIIWLYLYTPGISPLVDVFESTGATWDLSTLLGAVVALANVATWLHAGYNVILFYAALQSIPPDVLEAARIDGAGALRTAFSIKAPMIRGAITVATLFTVVGAMQLFAEPLLLRSRATAITSTWTPNMFIYQQAFGQHDFGFSAAAAVLFALVIGAASWVVTRTGRITS